MALQTSGTYETAIGTTVQSLYWRWTDLFINVASNTATVTFNGYVNQSAWESGKQPVTSLSVTVAGDEFVTLATQLEGAGSGLSSVIYEYALANLAEFDTATEV